MPKIKTVRRKNENQEFEEIPIGANAENIDFKDGTTLEEKESLILPGIILNLSNSATESQITNAFGGEDKIIEFQNAIKNHRDICFSIESEEKKGTWKVIGAMAPLQERQTPASIKGNKTTREDGLFFYDYPELGSGKIIYYITVYTTDINTTTLPDIINAGMLHFYNIAFLCDTIESTTFSSVINNHMVIEDDQIIIDEVLEDVKNLEDTVGIIKQTVVEVNGEES